MVLVPRANGRPGPGASFKFHLTAPGPAPGGQQMMMSVDLPAPAAGSCEVSTVTGEAKVASRQPRPADGEA